MTPKGKEQAAQPAKKVTPIPTPTSVSQPTQATAKAIKKEPMEVDASKAAAKKPKKDSKKEELRHGTSRVNNKINERDLKNPKDKDCTIY